MQVAHITVIRPDGTRKNFMFDASLSRSRVVDKINEQYLPPDEQVDASSANWLFDPDTPIGTGHHTLAVDSLTDSFANALSGTDAFDPMEEAKYLNSLFTTSGFGVIAIDAKCQPVTVEREAFYASLYHNEPQPQPTSLGGNNMSNDLVIKTVTQINGVDAESYSTEDLLGFVERQSASIERLKKLPSSEGVDRIIGKHEKTIAGLIEIVDSRA